MTGGLREGQGAQSVADGGYLLAHHQGVGVAQHHRLQAADAVHLQHGHVVGLLAADEGGVVLLAVIQGHLDGVGPVNDVVVGDNVAVLGEDEAGAAGGAGVLLPALLHRHLAGDVDAGVGVGGVDLLQGHLLDPVRLLHIHLGALGGVLVDGGAIGAAAAQSVIEGSAAQASAAAHQGTAQDQSCHSGGPVLLGGLGGGVDMEVGTGIVVLAVGRPAISVSSVVIGAAALNELGVLILTVKAVGIQRLEPVVEAVLIVIIFFKHMDRSLFFDLNKGY